MSIERTYEPIYALDPAHYGRCYYCGVEATHKDLVPPPRYVEVLEAHYGTDYRMLVPCCAECHAWLKAERGRTLEDRLAAVNKKLNKVYRKELAMHKHWMAEQLQEMSGAFRKSISAGMGLGKEAYDRLRFEGFSYEYNGQRHHQTRRERQIYQVLDETFDDVVEALRFAARAYRIRIVDLERHFLEVGDVEKAVGRVFDEVEKARQDKLIRTRVRSFCELYKQNERFVETTLRLYMELHPEWGIDRLLDKIYEERVARKAADATRSENKA